MKKIISIVKKIIDNYKLNNENYVPIYLDGQLEDFKYREEK